MFLYRLCCRPQFGLLHCQNRLHLDISTLLQKSRSWKQMSVWRQIYLTHSAGEKSCVETNVATNISNTLSQEIPLWKQMWRRTSLGLKQALRPFREQDRIS